MSSHPSPVDELPAIDTPFYTPLDKTPTTDTSYDLTPDGARNAAALIQRNYRGYRERRQLAGIGTDAVSRRWADTVKEAQWQDLTRARPRTHKPRPQPAPNSTLSTDARRQNAKNGGHSTFAQQEWRRLLQVARRAENDDISDSDEDETLSEAQRGEFRKQKRAEKKRREEYAKTMGLEYFLELVDEKHRYGSHLRAYHAGE